MATYKSAYSGPQIDEAIGRVLSGSTDGSSNRNLIDNPWFTVNQRNVADATTINGNNYFADRWQATGNGVQRVAGGGINVLGTAYHKLDNPGIAGKTVTLSILYSDGDISSNTFAWTGTSFSKTFKYGTVNIYPSANQINIGAQSVIVTAVKLELGSVSTLANDAPPDYGTELAKCQRYLQPVLFGGYDGGGLTNCVARWINSGFQVLAQVRLSPQMRAGPSALINNLSGAGRVVILDCTAGTVAGTPATTGFYLNSNPSPVSCYIYATTGSAQSMVDNGKYQYEIDAIATTGTLLVSAEP